MKLHNQNYCTSCKRLRGTNITLLRVARKSFINNDDKTVIVKSFKCPCCGHTLQSTAVSQRSDNL
jgi:hypothetical protein